MIDVHLGHIWARTAMAEVETLPHSLRLAVPVMKPAALAAAKDLFSSRGDGFRVFLDETCGMPSNWAETWRTWNSSGPRLSAGISKYVADSYILHLLENSPFVVSDWRRANVSVVALISRAYGGANLAAERCRRKMARESAAWRATGGARHVFILTSDRGPCCNSGQLMNLGLLQHHIAGHHGELAGHHWRTGTAPDIGCFHSFKDISIPTPNFVQPPPPSTVPAARDVLAFYAGGGLGAASGTPTPGLREGRRRLLEKWGNRTNHPDIVVMPYSSRSMYKATMAAAKYCPIMGGFAPWTPRLNEAVFAGCVPVIFSSLLPPFSRVLDWSQFTVRVGSLHEIGRLREILEQQDHAKLSSKLAMVRHALWFRLEGSYSGDDMLPFFILE